MRAIGITCGVGSMMIGARSAGFDVVGNVEWRRYYHHRDKATKKNTFTENFPGAFMVKKLDDLTTAEIADLQGIDLAMGHPECGSYSLLSSPAAKKKGCGLLGLAEDVGDIPVFIDLIARIRPRYFVADNLPRSLIGVPIHVWAEKLPDYDLFPEWISNYHYGNVQKHRKRFFMIGARKSERFVFAPDEDDAPGHATLLDVLYGIPAGDPNHLPHNLTRSCGKGKGCNGINRALTWGEARDWFAARPTGTTLQYNASDGTIKNHIGFVKSHTTHCNVLTGTNPVLNPLTNLPFSIRERLRIQGAPDDFKIEGMVTEPDGTWCHIRNMSLIRQTGKWMPVQFCEYIARQVADHIRGGDGNFKTLERCIVPNIYVDEAKKWFCRARGYADAEARNICGFCGVKKCNRGGR